MSSKRKKDRPATEEDEWVAPRGLVTGFIDGLGSYGLVWAPKKGTLRRKPAGVREDWEKITGDMITAAVGSADEPER